MKPLVRSGRLLAVVLALALLAADCGQGEQAPAGQAAPSPAD